jgi:hypothetical protein
MNCEKLREAYPVQTDEGRDHLSSCAGCRAFARAWELLGQYPSLTPGPGFLQGIRRKLAPRVLRFAAPLAAAAAALLVAAVLWLVPGRRPPEPASPEELELVENLELLEDYELLKTLELVGDSPVPLLEERK